MIKFANRLAPIFAVAVLLSLGVSARADFSAEEIKMGQDASKEVEKQSKLITDPAVVKRVNDIGHALVAVSDESKAEWSFKVLDDKDVNAFALPGGFVYVYNGLLKKVESDDELAGVLAHEITHATRHHALKLMKKSKPYDLASMAVLLAGIFSGKDISGLGYGLNILSTAGINNYTIGLEEEADAGGMDLMMKSKFNPVGMLTFMERLARDEAHSGQSGVDMGIFRNHPYSPDRAAALKATLVAHNIPINRRAVTNSSRVVALAIKVQNQDAATLKIDNETVLTLAADGTTSAMDRAKVAADKMNELLDDDLRYREVSTDTDGVTILARNAAVIKVSDADAKLAGKPPTALAEDAAKNIQRVLWTEYIAWNS